MELLEPAGIQSLAGSIIDLLPEFPKPKVRFDIEYLAETHDPVIPIAGPRILPSKTFDEVASRQFDIILVPGGEFIIQLLTRRIPEHVFVA